MLFHTPIKDERTINYPDDARSILKSVPIFYTFEHVLYKYIFFVSVQGALLSKRKGTLVTRVRLFAAMNSLVSCQRHAVAEGR